MHYGCYDIWYNVTSVMHYGCYDIWYNVTSVMHYGRYDFEQSNVHNALRNALRKHYGRYAPGAASATAQRPCAELQRTLAWWLSVRLTRPLSFFGRFWLSQPKLWAFSMHHYGRYDMWPHSKMAIFWLQFATIEISLQLWQKKWWHSKIQTILNNFNKNCESILKIEDLTDIWTKK